MIELKFKKWLELFGQGIEPPLQDPTKVSNGAFPSYSVTVEDPIVNLLKSKRAKKSRKD